MYSASDGRTANVPGSSFGQAYFNVQLPCGMDVTIKSEGLCKDASIKAKPAEQMVRHGLAQGLIHPDIGIIETSSGNFGRATARVCAELGIPATIIVDPNVTTTNVAVMEAFGTLVSMVKKRDAGGGYQRSRIAHLMDECRKEPRLYWLNQYDNPNNALSHEKTTGPELLSDIPDVDVVFCAVGTGGTTSGLGRFFAEHRPRCDVIACDVVGSVTFGGPAGPRFISGPGNSFVPGNWNKEMSAAQIYVPEAEAVAACHWLAEQHGLLLGGSTGLAIAGAIHHFKEPGLQKPKNRAVVISADSGEKYLEQIWNRKWLDERYTLRAISEATVSLGLA